MKVGIIGMGYVGLPLAVAFADAGHEVYGVEVDAGRVAALDRGESYVEDIASERLQAVQERLHATTRYADLAKVEKPAWMPALTQIIATNRPITIEGTPVMTSAMNRTRRATGCWRPYSLR